MIAFFRALERNDKAAALLAGVSAERVCRSGSATYPVNAASLRRVPGAPFAYWVSDRIRDLYATIEPFEAAERTVKQGLATADDFRFVRASWEIPYTSDVRTRWLPFAKGGSFARFYRGLPVVVNWACEGKELKAWAGSLYNKSHWSRILKNVDFYTRPGLTWPLRGIIFSAQAVPAGCVFSVAGKMAFAPRGVLTSYLALLNSRPVDSLMGLYAGKIGGVQYEVGLVGRVPVPVLTSDIRARLATLALAGWSTNRGLDAVLLASHACVLPALLMVEGASILARSARWQERRELSLRRCKRIQAELNDAVFQSYGIDGEDRVRMEHGFGAAGAEEAEGEADEDPDADGGDDEAHPDIEALTKALVSWLVGAAFGRFDVRLATGEVQSPPEPDPFEALPVCSPGMLVGPDGLPATRDRIASVEWCNARPDANRLPETGSVTHAQIHAVEYPLDIAWEGLLVDDPGLATEGPADLDIVRRVRLTLELIFQEQAGDIEAEMCEILGVKELRTFLRKPNAFFQDDLKRYSKSRRKAPICWPLSTESGSYTVWVCYPRLSQDTLYRIVTEHVEPKLTRVAQRVAQLTGEQGKAEGRNAARITKELGELQELQGELESFKDELLRIAGLPYKPDLNDGVQISAAPLYSLFKHKPWQKVLKKTWQELEEGKYDWARLAQAIWPERVKEKCKTDESLAIAHDLEDLYEG